MRIHLMALALAAVGIGIALSAEAVFAVSGSQPGEVSGPAAGKTTVPNAAAQRQASDGGASSVAGGPGVAAKGGTEGGPAPAGKEQPKSR